MSLSKTQMLNIIVGALHGGVLPFLIFINDLIDIISLAAPIYADNARM